MRCCITTRVGHASTEIPPPPPQRFISYGLLGLGVLFSTQPALTGCMRARGSRVGEVGWLKRVKGVCG